MQMPKIALATSLNPAKSFRCVSPARLSVDRTGMGKMRILILTLQFGGRCQMG